MLKLAKLVHDDLKGFTLVADDFTAVVDVGAGEEVDWDLAEKQANSLGYTLDI